jgi:hypothetical protein
MFANVASRKTTKTSEVVGKEGVVCPMSMMMLNFHIQIAKLLRSFVLKEDHASILINNSVVESTAMKTFILTKVVANIRQ